MMQIFVIFILIAFFLQTFSALVVNQTPTYEEEETKNTSKITFYGSAIANATVTYVMTELRFLSNLTGLKKSITDIEGVEWVLESNGRYTINTAANANRSNIAKALNAIDPEGKLTLQAYISVPKNITFTSFAGENRSDISLPDRITATISNPAVKIGDTLSFKILVDVRNGVHSQPPIATQHIADEQLSILFLTAEGTVMDFEGYLLNYNIEWDNISLVNTTAINASIPYETEIDFVPNYMISFSSNVSNLSYLQNPYKENNKTIATVSIFDKDEILNDIPDAEFLNTTLNIFVKTKTAINLSEAYQWAPGELVSIYKSVKANASNIYDANNKTYSTTKTFSVLASLDTEVNDTITYTLQTLLRGERIIDGRGQDIKTIPQ